MENMFNTINSTFHRVEVGVFKNVYVKQKSIILRGVNNAKTKVNNTNKKNKITRNMYFGIDCYSERFRKSLYRCFTKNFVKVFQDTRSNLFPWIINESTVTQLVHKDNLRISH